MTPLKQIRQKCLECQGRSGAEVRRCNIDTCTLHPYRFGTGNGNILKAIRKFCLNCSAGEYAEVKNCEMKTCPLYRYRNGRNPSRKGIGRTMAKK